MSALWIATTTTMRVRHVAATCMLCSHRKPNTTAVCLLTNAQTSPLVVKSKPRVHSSDSSQFDWAIKMVLTHLIEPSAYPLMVSERETTEEAEAVTTTSDALDDTAAESSSDAVAVDGTPSMLLCHDSDEEHCYDGAMPCHAASETASDDCLGESIVVPVNPANSTEQTLADAPVSAITADAPADTSGNVQELIQSFESRSSSRFNVRPASSSSTPDRQSWNWRYVRHSIYESSTNSSGSN